MNKTVITMTVAAVTTPALLTLAYKLGRKHAFADIYDEMREVIAAFNKNETETTN